MTRRILRWTAVFCGLAATVAAGQGPVTSAAAGQTAMEPDADPPFEVATIKPDPSGYPGMLGLGQVGRNFNARNVSLIEMNAYVTI